MTYYADLSLITLFAGKPTSLVAVGWLDKSHEYQRGTVSAEVFGKLVGMLVDPWEPATTAGYHRCPFCIYTGGPAEIRYRGDTARIGSTCLFVPSEAGVFVAPSLIAHYIDAHEYNPPESFSNAVVQSPDMKSIGYLRLIAKHGISRLLR